MYEDSEFERQLKKFLDERNVTNPETRATIRQHILEVRDRNRQEGLDKEFSIEDFLRIWEMSKVEFTPDVKRALEAYGKGPKKL